ncbi:N-acetylmannosamine-6-phosphate 2-epimerase [Bacillus sp. SA1-12]|nr:N-acetylmannosamine-6-phosphate 2-epimerase [Bacillus sp. SA1-12]
MLNGIKGKLIVSCQALDGEPLHGSCYMAKMAKAAKQGGAAAIRANSKEDIMAIKKETNLPVIGIVKRNYQDSDVYITATLKEVKELIEAGTDIITLDATLRRRPDGVLLEELITYIRTHSSALIMGDVSTVDEGIAAVRLGFDILSTTLSGYTEYSPSLKGPDFQLVSDLVKKCEIPVLAEGRISTPSEAKEAFERGAFAVVVGSAITRPQLITKGFADALEECQYQS